MLNSLPEDRLFEMLRIEGKESLLRLHLLIRLYYG